MKLVDEPITPRFKDQELVAFDWRGRRYAVLSCVLQQLTEGKWWLTLDLSGTSRHTFRVQARHGQEEVTLEIQRESKEGQVEWTVARIAD